MDITGYESDGLKIDFFDDVETLEDFLNSPKEVEVIVESSIGKKNDLLSGKYVYHKIMNNAQSFKKQTTNGNKYDVDVFLWSTGEEWVFTEEYMFGRTNPINWLKLKTSSRSIKYLKTDWMEHSGELSKVTIDFNSDLGVPPTIFLDIEDNNYQNYYGEYVLKGRLNNAPYYTTSTATGEYILMMKDSSWSLCEENYGKIICQIKLEPENHQKNIEIKSDQSLNDILDETIWLMFTTKGDYIDKLTTSLNRKKIWVLVHSTNDYYWWSGDDITIVHQTKFTEFIQSKVILKEGDTYKWTSFDGVRPDDRFVVKNGGNDGVFIKELLFDDKTIRVNGKSSFWIDGNGKQCDRSKVIEVSGLTIVNGEVTWTPCNN